MFATMIHRFLSHLRLDKQASPHTIRAYSTDLNSLRQFLEQRVAKQGGDEHRSLNMKGDGGQSSVALSELSTLALQSYFGHCKEQRLKPETIRRRHNAFCSCFKYAVEVGMLATNPLENVPKPEQEYARPQLVSMTHINQLLEAPTIEHYLGLRDRVILELFVCAALTTSEMVALNRSDFNLKTSLLSVGVGHRRREIKLPQHVVKRLELYLNHRSRYKTNRYHTAQNDSTAIFLNCDGNRLSARSIDRRIAKYLDLYWIDAKITPQAIRETVAIHWLKAGVHMDRVKKILGLRKMRGSVVYRRSA